jgi:rare lipoprotein A (peptidoglycan hydrolase)
MKSTKRALAMALISAGLLAIPVAAHATTSQSCSALFVPTQFNHMLHRAYRGTAEPVVGTYAALRVVSRCQIYPGGHRWAARAWRLVHYRWAVRRRAERRHAAATPTPASMNVSTMSWYIDNESQTASGVHDYYGFAACGYGGCVPMGTRIEFCNVDDRARCVVATRDDSGPYVGGREFDLNQNVKAAIGFDGLGPVAWAIVK